MRSDLTPDEKALADTMSAVSEAGYAASWMTDLEFSLWRLMTSGGSCYGRAVLKQEEIERLRELSEKCGGWIVFEDAKERFVPMTEWKRMFAAQPDR